jgi:flagellar biosynthesis/type III secretory pathway protein FliH
MIEFIIPLNLPVRAVEITETTARPSPRLLKEMDRWAATHQDGVSLRQDPAGMGSSGAGSESSTTERQHSPDEVQKELESLRSQQALFAGAIRELQHVTKVVRSQLDGMIQEFQEAAVELAHAVAAKLMFEEIDSNRFPIVNVVHEVVSRLDADNNSVIRLHPDDLALVQAHQAIGDADNEQSVRFVADSSLARGDCKGKAGEISVIYELRRQIDEIRRQLLSTVSGHAET